MQKYDLSGLTSFLRDEYGSDLRWVANYNSKNYDYDIQFVKASLKNELKGNQLDYIIHRSLAVYNKRHTEEVYFHLGESNYLITDYERGTAFHIFLDDTRGVTIMLEPNIPVTLPAFVETCQEKIALA